MLVFKFQWDFLSSDTNQPHILAKNRIEIHVNLILAIMDNVTFYLDPDVFYKIVTNFCVS